MAVLRNRQPTANIQDDFFETQTTVNSPINWQSNIVGNYVNPINKMKYKILWQSRFYLGTNNISDNAPHQRFVKKYIRINKRIKFNTDPDENEKTLPQHVIVWWICAEDGSTITALDTDPVYHETTYKTFFDQ